jgi:hypothetical protein
LTKEQIDQLKEVFGDGLGRVEIPEEAIGLIVGRRRNDLLRNLVHVVQEFVKIVMGFTIPRLKVDRSRTPQEVVGTLKGMEQEVDAEVMATMPGRDTSPGIAKSTRRDADYSLAETIVVQGPNGGEGDAFCFFQMEKEATDEDISEEFRSRRLRPADAYEVCRINEGNSDFTYKYPNATIWQVDGVWHFIACYAHLGRLYVRVKVHTSSQWNKGFWFVGVPLA